MTGDLHHLLVLRQDHWERCQSRNEHEDEVDLRDILICQFAQLVVEVRLLLLELV
jgi:hypothetical protein